MNSTRSILWSVIIGSLLPLAVSCVPMEKYKQLEWDHRALQAEKSQLETELHDERNAADTLRSRLTHLEGELDAKEQLVDNLRDERNMLQKAFDRAQQALEKLADQAMPTEPVVITETKLPPELDTALREFAEQFPDVIEYDQEKGFVKWKSDLLFALGSDVVKESAKSSLRDFVEVLNSPAAEGFEVLVVGHTDNKPIKRPSTKAAHPTNWHLSVHRSISVAMIILDNGYTPRKVGVMGFGEYRPVVPNTTEENQARNRRVEIYLVEEGDMVASAGDPNLFYSSRVRAVCAKLDM